ncbi:MAG: hypothetical protein JSU93_02120 [Methanobacteriota archaeon]|nr:MAG: hypothetical protein JSU93_02120 [Euryarchaeota archaeon]
MSLMLKEEFRSHATYSGKERFLTFPVFVFFLSTVVGLTLNRITETVTLEELATFSHLSAFIYGLSVGAFGLMGRQHLERRYGRSNYLVTMPYLLPFSFRAAFLGIFLRDALFYMALLLAPATMGLVFVSPMMGFSLVSISLFFVAVLATFMLGLSLSFLASVLFIRSVPMFLGLTGAIAALFLLHLISGLPPLGAILPSLEFQMAVAPFGNDAIGAAIGLAASALAVVLMTFAACASISVRIETSSQSYPVLLPSYFARIPIVKGLNLALISKELVDLRRSGTVTKMFFSLVLPLLFLSFAAWFINNGLAIPVGFNTVFYAAMVGFIGILMYNWLNNIDLSEYYSLIPVTVPQLIRARIIVFLVLTLGISAFFVIGISIINSDTQLIWLALIVMFVTSLYMVALTAYLTGLKTNTFLFDTSILAKFSVMSFLPDVCLTILSFSLLSDWAAALTGIVIVLFSMLFTTLILYRGIEKKWLGYSFAVG